MREAVGLHELGGETALGSRVVVQCLLKGLLGALLTLLLRCFRVQPGVHVHDAQVVLVQVALRRVEAVELEVDRPARLGSSQKLGFRV